MTIRLPQDEAQKWPMLRVLTQPRFSSTSSWTVLPMLQREDLGTGANGFYVESFNRCCLPGVGEAALRFHFGVIDGKLFTDDASRTSAEARAPDLVGAEIRIQGAPAPTRAQRRAGLSSFHPQWRTVWWGTCEHHVDTLAPGASFSHGQRLYLCADGLFRAKRWPLRRHGLLQGGVEYAHVEGHPGYNFSWWDGFAAGNRDGSSYPFPGDPTVSVDFHCLAGTFNASGDAKLWTDLQAAEHALASSRGAGDPDFRFSGTTDALTVGKSIWNVDDQSEMAWDLLARICDRRRGRGVVFPDWDDDVGNPTGPLRPKLTVRPQFASNILLSLDSGPANVTGAIAAGTTRSVDLIGDHRNIMDRFRMTDRHQHVVDYIESVGEPIEVLCTLAYADNSLAQRWDDAEAGRFVAVTDPLHRLDRRWLPVYQLHGTPNGWNFQVGDGNGGPQRRVDLRCDDNGGITQPRNGNDTSILLCEILRDLPLYDSYDYSGPIPVRFDGAPEKQVPARRTPMVFLRAASNRYRDGRLEHGLAMALELRDLLIELPDDGGAGLRFVGDTTVPGLGSTFDFTQLAVTVALRLPHRVRQATGDAGGRRKLRIVHQGIHLWMADAGAIWDLDYASRDADGAPPRRAASGGAGFLRDDRDILRVLHGLAAEWYSSERRTAGWSLRACGFLPSFDVEDAATLALTPVAFPQLGQLVSNLAAGGNNYTVNTPITNVAYDNVQGITSWETDWQDLDFVA